VEGLIARTPIDFKWNPSMFAYTWDYGDNSSFIDIKKYPPTFEYNLECEITIEDFNLYVIFDDIYMDNALLWKLSWQ